MKSLSCSHCGNRVYFENQSCESCGSALGYSPQERRMLAFESAADPGGWLRLGEPGDACKPCANRAAGVCNWMEPLASAHDHCVSCRTTHTIPALGKPENQLYWGALEQAKRRLMYSLLELGLPVPNKIEDPENGLSFEFLEEVDPQQRVLTGHDEGVITLNIAEADDAERERIRLSMHEPYRTLLGHFRHEIGHYYWDRLVRDSQWIDEFRQLFGDERADYAQALQAHYEAPAADWPQRCISVYASSHPWEDWAETWAHYLHMVDGLETAAAWGMQLGNALPGAPPLDARAIDPQAESVQQTVVDQWLPVSQFINAMDRSLGAHDSYPFVMPQPVIEKIDFVHRVVRAATSGQVPMNFMGQAGEASPSAEVAPAPEVAQPETVAPSEQMPPAEVAAPARTP